MAHIQRHHPWYQYLSLILPVLVMTLVLSRLKSVQQLFIKASYQPANLIVDTVGMTGTLVRPWQNLAQGGESAEFSLKPMFTDLNITHPQYIRLDHLFDFYIKVTRNGNGFRYDFSKLDRLLAEMKTIQALPFISLSYMPDVLNSDITGVPSDYEQYQVIIRQTIEHISGKQGLNLANVYYEVWNEPDLFGQWKTYGTKNYLDLYRAAAKGAITATQTQSFKFGGPATTKLYDNWVINLLTMVQSENLPFDFYSWHHYNHDPDAYTEDVKRLQELMKNYPDIALKVEYVISEWGIDSDHNQAYDNSVGAAHLVASVVNFPPNLSKAFLFEIQDGKSPENREYWGRWGLYTHSDYGSHPKPRAKAVQLLNQLGEQELSLIGQGSHVKAIAAKLGSTIQVLLTNYDYNNKHAEEVPLQLKRLKPGNYTITRTFLGRSKTSVTINIPQSDYKLTVPMAPNSVALYEFTPERPERAQ